MKKMRITLHKDGTQKLDVLDAVGEDCRTFTKAMETRLGVQSGDRVLKPEHHETEDVSVPVHEAGS